MLALKELSIRGDISTTIDFIGKLIESQDFVENNIDTSWLDQIIKRGGINEELTSNEISRKAATRDRFLNNDTLAVIGATVVSFDQCTSDEATFLELLERGQLPPLTLLKMVRDVLK